MQVIAIGLIRPEFRVQVKNKRFNFGFFANHPTAAQTAEIDTVIRDAASNLFLEVGSDVARMDSVAAATGVYEGTLCTRFAGKVRPT